jgi:hypothetical protein
MLLPTLLFLRSIVALQAVEFLVAVCCGVTLLFFGFWSWFFRDGLKAGFVPSEGATALIRFFELFWLPLLVVLGITALSHVF